MIGQTISHYRIVEKLGEGGMGVVYKAEDLKLGRAVALKFLPSHLLESDEHKARFLHEARAAALLDHPNICTVYEIDEIDGQAFLAMACLEGQTLKQKIAARPLPLDEAIEIAIQIGHGLQAAHEKGVVHRDIKPSNIMITPQGQVKIMDFGLAQLSDRTKLTASGMKVGTPAYMSPEQAEGKPADRRSDIWSLGVVLYEMISGRMPFAGESEAAVARAILDDEAEPLTALRSGLPIEMDRIVAKALAKKRTERYQNVEDLLVDLRSCGKVSLRPVSRLRSRLRWVAGAAACAAALAAGLWIGRSGPDWHNPLEGARYTRVTDFEGTETDPAISPDGKLIAFLSDRDGQFDLWVTQAGTQNYHNLTQSAMSGFPRLDDRPIGFSNDGGHIWFHQRTGRDPPWTTMLIPAFGGPARPFLNAVSAAWSFDGRRLVYHTAESGDPTFLSDPDGANAIGLFRRESGVHAHHPVWSPDGRFIYFASGYPPDQMDIWRAPVGGGTPERLTRHNSRVRCPTLLDDETLLYSATADDGLGSCLYVMNVEERIARRATAGLEQYVSVAADEARANPIRRLVATLVNPAASLWAAPISSGIAKESALLRISTPNAQAQGPRTWGDAIFYLVASGPSHALWRRESQVRASELWKASGGGLAAPPAISPDGRLICFSFRREDRAALYVMNVDGTGLRTLSHAFQVRSAASWSPDSKWVAVSGDEGKGSRVFKLSVEGGEPVRLLDSEAASPVWSPDGRMIVYAGPNIGGVRAVFAMTPDGKPLPFPQVSVILRMDGYRFLPDGKSMVVLQGLAPRQAFWLLDLATGERRQLTDLEPGFEIQGFDVTPDGKQIVFDRIRTNADVVLMELPQV